MEEHETDLLGQVCPYPVMRVVRAVDTMGTGQILRFLVDDPLAIKSIPEELEEYDDISVAVLRSSSGWEIIISRA